MATSGSWNVEWPSSTWGGYPKGYRWKGNFSRSGNVLTLSNMTLQIFMLSGSGYGTASDTVTITGQPAQTVTFTMNGAESNVASLSNSQIAVTSTQSSLQIQCAIAGEETGSTTIYFDPASQPPSGLAVTNITPGTESFSATVSVTAWNGGSTDTRYRSLSICTAQSTTNRRVVYARGNELSSTLTVDNTSTVEGTCTLTPNTGYYLRSTATNGLVAAEGSYTRVATLAPKPTVSLESVADNSATIAYTVPADGGFYSKTIEYSLDGGTTWITAATITGGSAAQGTFTITDLTAGEHTVLVRSRTTAGTDGSVSVTFNTAAVRLITSDGIIGKEANRVLVSVDGQATEVTRILVSHNGTATESA